MTAKNAITVVATSDDSVFKAMEEINRAFFSVAQRRGVSVASDGLANILVKNLASYGEKVAVATLRKIAANARPIARMWGAVAGAADYESGHS